MNTTTTYPNTIAIGRYTAQGPFLSIDYLRALQGVYIILGRSNPGNWTVVDVGESDNDVRNRVRYHNRAGDWKACGFTQLSVAVIYTNSDIQRMAIERELRQQYSPLCGDR